MPEPIADATDIAPGKAGAQDLGLIAKPDRRLADHLEFALDRCDSLGIAPKRRRVHTLREVLDVIDRFGNIA